MFRLCRKLNGKFFEKLAIVVALLAFASFSVDAQKREHLTVEEIEIVRDAQELDKRTEVFIKAIDRRFQVLGVAATAANGKKAKKEKADKSDWGAPPAGTRAELLGDIAKILEEAMNNLDNVYTRDEKNALIPKSLKILAAAAERFAVQIKSFSDKAASEKEREAAYQIARELDDIIKANNGLTAAN